MWPSVIVSMLLQVYVHPKSAKPTYRHVKYRDRRPVLAARYEPTSRILALLLRSVPPHRGEPEYVVAFCAFTHDYAHLQKTHELAVTLPGACTVGPEGAPLYTGELPFLLLPAVADRDGGGTASKVRSPAGTADKPGIA